MLLSERRQAVRDAIVAGGPSHFEIRWWMKIDNFHVSSFALGSYAPSFNTNDCQTTGCIAGWTAVAAHRCGIYINSPVAAAEFLGIEAYVEEDGHAEGSHPFDPLYWYDRYPVEFTLSQKELGIREYFRQEKLWEEARYAWVYEQVIEWLGQLIEEAIIAENPVEISPEKELITV